MYHKGLLKFALSADTIRDTLVVFVADMSRPWTIMESLLKWASVLREHIDKLKIPPEEMRDLEQKSKCERARRFYRDVFERSDWYLAFNNERVVIQTPALRRTWFLQFIGHPMK